MRDAVATDSDLKSCIESMMLCSTQTKISLLRKSIELSLTNGESSFGNGYWSSRINKRRNCNELSGFLQSNGAGTQMQIL